MAGRVDLDEGELRRLTQEVVAPQSTEPFGAYLFWSHEPAAELGRHLERTVFQEAFGNTPDLLAEEYDPYEPSSLFICVVDHVRRLPAGMMRVLLPSSAGFKSLRDIEPVWGEPAAVLIERTGLAVDLARTWDVATYAVARDYRAAKASAGFVSMGLYQTLTLAARGCGIEWLVAILDMPVFRILRWKLHLIFAGYKGVAPRAYLGSTASIPAWCNLIHAQRHHAEVDPPLHDILFEGVGLEPALRRADLSKLADAGCKTRLASGQ